LGRGLGRSSFFFSGTCRVSAVSPSAGLAPALPSRWQFAGFPARSSTPFASYPLSSTGMAGAARLGCPILARRVEGLRSRSGSTSSAVASWRIVRKRATRFPPSRPEIVAAFTPASVASSSCVRSLASRIARRPGSPAALMRGSPAATSAPMRCCNPIGLRTPWHYRPAAATITQRQENARRMSSQCDVVLLDVAAPSRSSAAAFLMPLSVVTMGSRHLVVTRRHQVNAR